MKSLLVAAVSLAVVSTIAAVAGVVWLVLREPAPEVRIGTQEDFCAAFLDPFPLTDPETGEGFDFGANQREYADRMLAAGLPAQVGPRVRAGLAVFAALAEDLPEDVVGNPDDVPRASAEQDDAYRAFDRWSRRTCGKPF